MERFRTVTKTATASAARQHLPGRPRGWSGGAGGAGVLPVRPGNRRSPLPRHVVWESPAAHHLPPHPPQSQTGRPPGPNAAADRHRLPVVDRGRPPRADPPRRTHRISRPLRRGRAPPNPGSAQHSNAYRRPSHRQSARCRRSIKGCNHIGTSPGCRSAATWPRQLHRHHGHDEAVARITWCMDQRALGVLTGEVGAGKTVAVRAASAALDPSRHALIYLPNPSIGARGITPHVTALGGAPRLPHAPPSCPKPPTRSPRAGRTRPHPHPGHRRSPPARPPPTRGHPHADQLRPRLPVPIRRLLIGQPTLRRRLKLGVLAALDQRIAVRYAMRRHDPRGDRQLHRATSQSPAGPTPCSPTTPSR